MSSWEDTLKCRGHRGQICIELARGTLRHGVERGTVEAIAADVQDGPVGHHVASVEHTEAVGSQAVADPYIEDTAAKGGR